MTDFSHDHIKPFADDRNKKEQVIEMFDALAARYDFMNGFLSAGVDVTWRKKAIKIFKNNAPHHLLDVATGTADVAIMAAKLLNTKKITGIDISQKMLEIGRQKVFKEGLEGKIELVSGDCETINFSNNSFDGVIVAFGVRNFENLEKGLSEIFRVMKPGAQLVVLEFSKPVIPGVENLYNLYMGIIAPEVAGWFTRNKKAYQYLNESAKAFPDRQAFINILKKQVIPIPHLNR